MACSTSIDLDGTAIFRWDGGATAKKKNTTGDKPRGGRSIRNDKEKKEAGKADRTGRGQIKRENGTGRDGAKI